MLSRPGPERPILMTRCTRPAARRKGDGYGVAEGRAVDAAANDPVVRELATTAREFDPAEIHHGEHGAPRRRSRGPSCR